MRLRILRREGMSVVLTTLTLRDVFISASNVIVSALVFHGEITVSVCSFRLESV
jgi:hypothetical protein